jgi:hypothetical protein
VIIHRLNRSSLKPVVKPHPVAKNTSRAVSRKYAADKLSEEQNQHLMPNLHLPIVKRHI